MTLRVGSLVFTTDQGLGYLAKDFYDEGVVTNVMTVSHGKRQEHPEWYPNAAGHITSFSAQAPKIRDFCKSMDAMLFFETPFAWDAIEWCRACNVKTILMPMHECMPEQLPAIPDVMACPSDLDYDLYHAKKYGGMQLQGCRVVRVDVPVPRWVKWRLRTTAETFVHNAGNGGLKGRNGTVELLSAMLRVDSNAELLLRCQEGKYPGSKNVIRDLRTMLTPPELYESGHVFVFPEAFNGLSLPLQEAFASGMCVMATERYPNTSYLPLKPLIPTRGQVPERISPRLEEYKRAIIDPANIAAKIDEWYGRDITEFSLAGKAFGERMSWDVQLSKWRDLIERTVAR